MRMAPIVPGAQSFYATDFREYALGSELKNGDWTETEESNFNATIVADTGSLSGRSVSLDKTSSDGRRSVWWNRVGSVSDVEILARFKFDQIPAGASETLGGLVGRLSSDGDTFYDALASRSSGTKTLRMIELVDGVGGSATSTAALEWNTTNRWWLRFQLRASTIRARMWQSGTAESGSWVTSFSDSTIASGRVGLFIFHTDAAYKCDWFSVASGTGTAPGPSG